MLNPESIETGICRYGRVAFFRGDNIVSHSLREYGEWAQLEIALLRRLIEPGDSVVDVGAFIGTHSLAFADRVGESGRVYAFEAIEPYCEVLKINLERNGCTNVVVFNAALSNKQGSIAVAPKDVTETGNFGGATLELIPGPETDNCEIVRLDVLDQYQITNCSLIKIDTEGMEGDILNGCRETLRRTRPVVYAECNSLQRALPVLDLARDENYAPWIAIVGAYNPGNFLNNPVNIFGEARETSLLLIPAERKLEIENRIRTLDSIRVSVIPIASADDLVLAMLKKPQYKYEVLAHTAVARVLGIDFWRNEPDLYELISLVTPRINARHLAAILARAADDIRTHRRAGPDELLKWLEREAARLCTLVPIGSDSQVHDERI